MEASGGGEDKVSFFLPSLLYCISLKGRVAHRPAPINRSLIHSANGCTC